MGGQRGGHLNLITQGGIFFFQGGGAQTGRGGIKGSPPNGKPSFVLGKSRLELLLKKNHIIPLIWNVERQPFFYGGIWAFFGIFFLCKKKTPHVFHKKGGQNPFGKFFQEFFRNFFLWVVLGPGFRNLLLFKKLSFSPHGQKGEFSGMLKGLKNLTRFI